MKRSFVILSLFLLFGLTNLLSYGKDGIVMSKEKLFYQNQRVRIESWHDLGGKEVTFENCQIVISHNGGIVNASLKGYDNLIEAKTRGFSDVKFTDGFLKGRYLVSWWMELDSIGSKFYNNRKIQEIINSVPDHAFLFFDNIREVLSDPVFKIANRKSLTVDFSGTLFYTDKSHGTNSEFFTIANSDNIKLQKLRIIGDARFHSKEDKGEWGMGIVIRNSRNVCLSECWIDKCWGDNIYITGNSKGAFSTNITIESCTLRDARRNNISVIDADSINILSCNIIKTNRLNDVISMTAPNAGIDLEPNHKKIEHVSNICIKDSYFQMNNVGAIGIQVYNNLIGENLNVRNCSFADMKMAFALIDFHNIEIDYCHFDNIITPVLLRKAKNIHLHNCIYRTANKRMRLLQNEGSSDVMENSNTIITF